MSKSTQSSKPSPPDKGKMVSPSVKPVQTTEPKKPAPVQQESQPDSVPTASANSEPQATVKTESQAKAQPPKSSPEAPASDVSGSPTPAPRYYVRYRKPNYIKYDRNKQVLVDLLRTGTHSTEFIAHKAGIASNSTLYKYQSLASNESGLLLMTREERDYMRDKVSTDTMVQIDGRLRDQNQGWKDRYVEADAQFVIQQKETPIPHKPRDTPSPQKTKAPKVQA